MAKKPSFGYENKPNKKKKRKEKSYVFTLFVRPKSKISWNEKIIKFVIYVALRLVIKPSKWKYPEKNYEIIDRTYRRIISTDFIYIPSSIAFYLIMAFVPIISLISMMYLMPGFSDWLKGVDPNHTDPLKDVLGRFIPGAGKIISEIRDSTLKHSSREIASVIGIITSLLGSTWVAAGGFAKLIFTQSYVYEHKFVGGYWMNKFKGMSLVFAFTIFLLISVVVNVAATAWIKNWGLNKGWTGFFVYIWLFFGLFLTLFGGMILFFKLSPRFKIRFKDVIPGAMVTSIPTSLFLGLFGSISSIWSYSSYGTIGAVMYIGMASLIVIYFIFLGLITNSAYYKTFVGEKLRNKWTISKK